MGLRGAFGNVFSSNTAKDMFSAEGQVALLAGQPGYLHEESKGRKKEKAVNEANANEASIVRAKNDAQDAANKSIIDARRRKRASSLVTSATPLGGASTALGAGAASAGQQAMPTALGYGGM